MKVFSNIWQRISLRTKITGVTVLLLVLGLFLSGFGVLTALRTYLVADSDRQLTRTLSQVTNVNIQDDERSTATEFVLARFNGAGKLLDANESWYRIAPIVSRSNLNEAFNNQTSGTTVSNANGIIALRIIAKPLGDGNLAVLGLPFDDSNRLVSQLVILFFIFGLITTMAGAILTRILVASTFAPLKQVERTAAAIANGDFGQRLTVIDVNTEVGRLNRSLNRMLARIDDALSDRARTIDQMRRFISDASHELRTPLVSVRGYAELYRMGALATDEDVMRAMERIEKEAIRLNTLVNDLLALARLDESREMTLKPVALIPLAHDAALDARALAPERKIRVITTFTNTPVVDTQTGPTSVVAQAVTSYARRSRRGRRNLQQIPPSKLASNALAATTTEPVISATEDRIRQLLTNLLGNAIRYTPEGSPIEVAAYGDVGRNIGVLEIIDHGEGIPAQVREKIFERFWRADTSRARDTGGSGLGLAIVSAIVTAHRGKIGIFETPGGGATFRVEFPLLPDEEPTPT